MRSNSMALATVIALFFNAIGVGLAPVSIAAAPVPDHNPASSGALPAWLATIPDDPYQATDPETYTDGTGAYRFEGLPHGTHKVTVDPATLPPGLRPTEEEAVPILWLTPGLEQASEALSTGVRFTAAYDGQSGTIAGLVFVDRDGDGWPGSGEPGLPGVRVIDPTVHQYYVPFNDANLWTLFDHKDTGLPGAQQCHPAGRPVTGTLSSSIFLIASSDGTAFYYDHWEDGYDANPLMPSTTTVAGVLDAGAFQIFQSDIDPAQVGDPDVLFYDGRDRITVVGEEASVVRQVYPSTPGVLLASAWEVSEVADWGTQFIATVGEDLTFSPSVVQDHDFAGLEVMAALPGTAVYYNGELLLPSPLNAGGTYFIDGANNGVGPGGVNSTDIITATGPVQVQMMTGACGTAYSANGYTLQPVNLWDSAYWAPVPGFLPDCNTNPSATYIANADTDIYLHNPHVDAITVTVSSDMGNVVVTIPPAATISVLDATGWTDISTGTHGVHLTSLYTFWGVAVVDSSTNSSAAAGSRSQNYDWGYSLVPQSELSSQVVIGYAPGNGDPLPLDNGNLAFVTAITDTVIYVDLNQDGLPDPVDMSGNGDQLENDVWGVPEWDEPLSALGIQLQAGQVLRVGDPNDHNLMGARIYTLDLEEKIAVAWGQDPCWADIISPYLDLGYTALPISIPRLSKTDDLAVDADWSGGVSPGDTITYTLVLKNNGTGSMSNVSLTDNMPYTYTSFVEGSIQTTTPPPVRAVEYYDGASWVTSPITTAQRLRIWWDTIGPGQALTVTFRVLLDIHMPVTIKEITNRAVVESSETIPRLSEDPDDPADPDTDTPVQRPLLSIDKSVSPTTVQPGGLITYTLVVSNYGNGVALLTAITDTLPSWVTYVSNTLNLTWPIAQVEVATRTITETACFHGYYADDFDLTDTQTTYYTGNDGSLNWTAPWAELLDNGDPGTGEIQVQTDVPPTVNALSAPAYLWMTDSDADDACAQRTADLSTFIAPVLRYYTYGNSGPGDNYRIDVNGNPALTQQYNGDWTLREIALTPGATAIGFCATGAMEDTDYYRFDNVAIYESAPQRVRTRTLTTESSVLSYTTSIGGNPVSYNPLTGQMVITEGVRLPASGVITATFQARVTVPLTDGLTLGNTACTTATNWLEVFMPPCDDAAVQVQSSHALTITKTASPSPVGMGSLLTYTLHYTITGDEAVEHAVVSDTTPVHTTFYEAIPTATSDPGRGNTGPVIWQVDGLLPGTGVTQTADTLTMVVLLDSPLISGTLIYNAVTISDTTDLTDTDEITTSVQAFADLAVSKTDDPDPVVPGSLLTYTLRVVNNGPNDAENVVVTDTLPTEVTFVSATPSDWNLGTLAVGETQTITVLVQVHSWVTQTFTNTVRVSSDTPDPNPGNNRDDEPTHPPLPGLKLVKTVQPLHAVHDMPFTYTLRIANTGDFPFITLRLTDTLPADFHYVVSSGRPRDPDAPIVEPVLVWSNLVPAGLEPGASLTVTFQVTTAVAANDSYINTATVEGTYAGGTLTDTDDAVVIIADPEVDVDKRLAGVDEDDVAPNFITFTIAITNVGPSTIDVLPLLDEYDPFYLAFENATPYPDEDANDGLLTWHDLTRPAPRGFGHNLPVSEVFAVTTVFRVVRDIPFTINTATVTDAIDIYSNPADPAEDDEIIGGIPTAIELLYFRAVAEEAAVRLEWATAAELDIADFRVYRALDRDLNHAQPIAYVPATGPGSTYGHLDRDVTPDQVYWYWLAEVNTDGTETIHGPVWGGVGPHALPYHFYLPLIQKGWENVRQEP